jgi:hypothetical protein
MTKQTFLSSAVRATLALLALVAPLAMSPKAAAQDDAATGITIRMRTTLTGPAINGLVPKGKAEFQLDNATRRFSAEADNVRLPNGTVLAVRVNGVRVGIITLQLQGGALLLTGVRAPNVTKGTRVVIRFPNGGPIVLSGTF